MTPLLFSLRRWRAGHLLLAWGTYWVGLAAVTLGPAIPAILRATAATDDKGSISAAFGDGLRIAVSNAGETLWTLTAPASEIAFWVVGPPLALWAAWLIRRRGARGDAPIDARRAPELPLPRAEDVTVEGASPERVNRASDRT